MGLVTIKPILNKFPRTTSSAVDTQDHTHQVRTKCFKLLS